MRRTIKRTVDLSVQRSTVDYVDSTAFYYNDSAHDWVVKVFNDGSPAELTGTVKVYCQLPSGDWVNSGDAVIEGNVVTGILIRDCYLQVGQILCVMQYTEPIAGTEDSIRLTLDAFYTRVQRGYAGEDPITPSDKVIMWDDVVAKMAVMDEHIEAMEEAMPAEDPTQNGTYAYVVDIEESADPNRRWENLETMTAGNADQLTTEIGNTDTLPYNFRRTNSFGGDRKREKIVGGTVAWNQLVQNGDFSDGTTGWVLPGSGTSTVTSNVLKMTPSAISNVNQNIGLLKTGHKYIFSCHVKSNAPNITIGIVKNNSSYKYKIGTHFPALSSGTDVAIVFSEDAVVASTDVYQFRIRFNAAVETECYLSNVYIVDLTQMFSSTIADYIYSLEQANAGAGVAWFRKLFPKPYYPYNAGELMSVKTSAHKTIGFNAWDEEWELGNISNTTGENIDSTNRIRSKNYIPVVPNTDYYITAPDSVGLRYYDANKDFIGYDTGRDAVRTTPNDCHYLRFIVLNQTTYNHDVCINLSNASRNGEYEPYEENVYPLDSDLELRGIPKLDSNNNLYYDGDTYESDGTVTRRYGIVDLGTLNWGKYDDSRLTVGYYFAATLSMTYGLPNIKDYSMNLLPLKYTYDSTHLGLTNIIEANGAELNKMLFRFSTNNIGIVDSACADTASLVASLSGIYLIYELATPTTESADLYPSPMVVDPYGTEAFIEAADRPVSIPVGHESFYMSNLKKKLERLPNAAGGNGLYVIEQTNNSMSLRDINASVSVSGTDATITAEGGKRYVCGELDTLTFTPASQGLCDVLFTSGTTPTILTVPDTVKWANGFDPTQLEANTVYELNVADGVYGVVSKWT